MAQTKLDNDSLALTSEQVAGRTYAGVLGVAGQYAMTLYPDTSGYSVFHLKAGQSGLDGLQFLTGSDAYSGPSTRMYLDGVGNLILGATSGNGKFTVSAATGGAAIMATGKSSGNVAPDVSITRSSTLTNVGQGCAIQFDDSSTPNNSRMIQAGAGNMQFFGYGTGGWAEHVRIDINGNLLVNTTSGTYHCVYKAVAQGSSIAAVGSPTTTQNTAIFYGVSDQVWNAAATAIGVGRNTSTSRSINAAGTINASGADYAEYMTKAEGIGTIAKGAIVGIDVDGHLTDKYAAAVSFLIKTTNPSYVGGDVWGSADAIGMAKPDEPLLDLPTYSGPDDPGEAPLAPDSLPENASDEDTAAYAAALEAYQAAAAEHAALMAAYQQAIADYQAAYQAARDKFDTVTMPAYQADLAKFNALLEAARERVDRIAYCGQVPVNVQGGVPGQYVVPIADGDGIAGQLVDAAAVTFDQYRRAVGIVQNILPDGRANVRVKPV